MKKAKGLIDQLFDEQADFRKMIDEASNEGSYSRTTGCYQKIVTELLLFIFLLLRRVFFISAILFGSILYLVLKS